MTTAQQQTAEQRKKLLIVQGQLFRLGILDAQHSLTANLRRDVLLKSAFAHVVNTSADVARNVFTLDGLSSGISSGRLALLLPVLTKAVGFLSRRHLLMPAGIVVAVAAAGYASWRSFKAKKRRKQAGEQIKAGGLRP
jgi:hypothetical protein